MAVTYVVQTCGRHTCPIYWFYRIHGGRMYEVKHVEVTRVTIITYYPGWLTSRQISFEMCFLKPFLLSICLPSLSS